mmetsp:Transcript_51097/g.94544  ORF Transcript_51097/g.94544 Transcript_51097/m.94544 type:complete len:270 (+) Transcript_51097:101-910(+)
MGDIGRSLGVVLDDFLGDWKDSMGNIVEVSHARAGNRGGQLDVVLKKPRGNQDPIRLNVKQHHDGHFTCGHYNLAESETRLDYIVWEDYRNVSRRSIWTRDAGVSQYDGNRVQQQNVSNIRSSDQGSTVDDKGSWEELKRRWRAGAVQAGADGVNADPGTRARSRSPRHPSVVQPAWTPPGPWRGGWREVSTPGASVPPADGSNSGAPPENGTPMPSVPSNADGPPASTGSMPFAPWWGPTPPTQFEPWSYPPPGYPPWAAAPWRPPGA